MNYPPGYPHITHATLNAMIPLRGYQSIDGEKINRKLKLYYVLKFKLGLSKIHNLCLRFLPKIISWDLKNEKSNSKVVEIEKY